MTFVTEYPDKATKRIPPSGKEGKNGIVLFHGISVGWVLYTQLIKLLPTDVDVFLFDVHPFKLMSLKFGMDTPDLLCHKVNRVLDDKGISYKKN